MASHSLTPQPSPGPQGPPPSSPTFPLSPSLWLRQALRQGLCPRCSFWHAVPAHLPGPSPSHGPGLSSKIVFLGAPSGTVHLPGFHALVHYPFLFLFSAPAALWNGVGSFLVACSRPPQYSCGPRRAEKRPVRSRPGRGHPPREGLCPVKTRPRRRPSLPSGSWGADPWRRRSTSGAGRGGRAGGAARCLLACLEPGGGSGGSGGGAAQAPARERHHER